MVIIRQYTIGEKGERLRQLEKKEEEQATVGGLTPEEKAKKAEILEIERRMQEATKKVEGLEREAQKEHLEKTLPSEAEMKEAEQKTPEERVAQTREKLAEVYQAEFGGKSEIKEGEAEKVKEDEAEKVRLKEIESPKTPWQKIKNWFNKD